MAHVTHSKPHSNSSWLLSEQAQPATPACIDCNTEPTTSMIQLSRWIACAALGLHCLFQRCSRQHTSSHPCSLTVTGTPLTLGHDTGTQEPTLTRDGSRQDVRQVKKHTLHRYNSESSTAAMCTRPFALLR